MQTEIHNTVHNQEPVEQLPTPASNMNFHLTHILVARTYQHSTGMKCNSVNFQELAFKKRWSSTSKRRKRINTITVYVITINMWYTSQETIIFIPSILHQFSIKRKAINFNTTDSFTLQFRFIIEKKKLYTQKANYSRQESLIRKIPPNQPLKGSFFFNQFLNLPFFPQMVRRAVAAYESLIFSHILCTCLSPQHIWLQLNKTKRKIRTNP